MRFKKWLIVNLTYSTTTANGNSNILRLIAPVAKVADIVSIAPAQTGVPSLSPVDFAAFCNLAHNICRFKNKGEE